jgi:hypothetical protein
MKQGTVIYLSPDDVVTPSLKKHALDIDIHDLMEKSVSAVEKADLAIFCDRQRGMFKVIKDRWGIGAMGVNIIK